VLLVFVYRGFALWIVGAPLPRDCCVSHLAATESIASTCTDPFLARFPAAVYVGGQSVLSDFTISYPSDIPIIYSVHGCVAVPVPVFACLYTTLCLA
jgi:hypothetical protein